MNDQGSPSLADDEATLARYATALADAFQAVAFPWFMRLVEMRHPALTESLAVCTSLEQGAIEVAAELRTLLSKDVADQTIGPLEILRRGVRHPTDVLAYAGVEPVDRDAFAIRNFPSDLYGLTPGSFADVDSSLHEPGLIWGAAKAHVFLRRRRESGAQ